MFDMGQIHNKKVSFSEHLNPLITYYITSTGNNFTKLFHDSGVQLKRKSDFEKGRKTLTAYYFIKLLGGAGLTSKEYEEKTEKRFTLNQTEALAYQKFCDNNEDLFKKAMRDPKLFKQLRVTIQNWDS